jgi:hypothetical protein
MTYLTWYFVSGDYAQKEFNQEEAIFESFILAGNMG